MRLLPHLFCREALPERRVRTVQITAAALLGLFQLDGTKALRMEGVPKDARVEMMWVDPDSQILSIAIGSEEFEPLPEGTIPAPIDVTVYVTELVPQQVREK